MASFCHRVAGQSYQLPTKPEDETKPTTPKHTSLSSDPSSPVYLDRTSNRDSAVLVVVSGEGEALNVLVVVLEAVIMDVDSISVLSYLESSLLSPLSVPL